MLQGRETTSVRPEVEIIRCDGCSEGGTDLEACELTTHGQRRHQLRQALMIHIISDLPTRDVPETVTLEDRAAELFENRKRGDVSGELEHLGLVRNHH